MAVKPQEASILTSLSFSQLEDELKDKVLHCARRCGKETAKTWPIDAKQLLLNRQDLSKALDRSKRFVSEIEPIGFPWLDANQVRYYEEELSFAFYLALADCELTLLENKEDSKNRRQNHLLHIGGLLAQLRNRDLTAAELETKAKLAHDVDDPTRYFGLLFIAPKMAEAIKKMTIDKVSNAVDYPASLNDGRLYLVWTAEMLVNICRMLRRSIRYISFFAADAFLDGVSFVTGSMGWILYFLRGGVDTAFLFEVSDEIKALGLSDNEKSECFIGKWNEKKFSILNDAVWGFVNCICFFILAGDGMLGYYGNVLNGALFIFDCALNAWQLSEAQTEHEAIMLDYKKDINALTEKIARDYHLKAMKEIEGEVLSQDQLDVITRSEWRLKALKRDRGKVERAWHYDMKQFQLDVMYSATIILAFAVLCCFFTPPGMATALTTLMFGLVGSAMCFGLGIVHAAFSSQLSISKTGEDSKAIETDYQDYLKLFGKALKNDNDNLKRMVFLDIRRTMANTDYQKQLIQYQRADMVCRIFTDMVVPVLFLAGFVFMPMTMGASVFAAGLVLLFAMKCYVAELAPEDIREDSIPLMMLTKFSGLFKSVLGTKPRKEEEKPKHPLLPEAFPEAAYQRFCKDFEGGVGGDALRKHFLPEPVGNKPQNSASDTFSPDPQ